MNPLEFTKRWVEGMKNLSVRDQIKGKIAGAYGNIFGFTGGIITMLYFMISKKEFQWWWTEIILVFALWVTIIDLVAQKQALKMLTGVHPNAPNMDNLRIGDGL